MSQQLDITIQQGKTFNQAFKVADEELVYKPITSLISTAPVRLKVVDHGLVDNWPILINCVKNPVQLNTEYPVVASVIDQDTIEVNKLVICCDRPYQGQGVIIFNKPCDLTGFTARASIRPAINSSKVLYEWSQVIVDTLQHAFILTIPADITATFNWSKAIYDLEAISPNGEVFSIISPSQVLVEQEVTK